MKFEKDKKYKFSFRKLQEDYARKGKPVGGMWKVYDGANIKVSKDLVNGMIHGYETKPAQMMNFNGMQVAMGHPTKEEVCLLVGPEWCEEVV